MASRIYALRCQPTTAISRFRHSGSQERETPEQQSAGADPLSYLILFVSAFGAATLLPFYSEVTLVALLSQSYPAAWLWTIATAGNTLGAGVNWLLGRYLSHFEARSWFPFKRQRLNRAQSWFQRWGKWSLLLAWLPIGGDALTFIAGMMRVHCVWFIVLTAMGKGARYAVIIALYLNVIHF